MPDPADIIAATMLHPPARPDAGIHRSCHDDTDTGLQYQYRSVMALPAAPELARHIAGAAIEALDEAGWVLVRAPGASTRENHGG